jgi:hypothetical protein
MVIFPGIAISPAMFRSQQARRHPHRLILDGQRPPSPVEQAALDSVLRRLA